MPRSDLLQVMRKSSAKRKSAAAASRAGDDESARGRLLSAATHLFCKDGINATGIDAIINEAGTAKTTLYKLFGSKTHLVHAVLEREGTQWREWFIAAMVSRNPGVADMAGLAACSLFGPAKVKKPKRAASAPTELVAV